MKMTHGLHFLIPITALEQTTAKSLIQRQIHTVCLCAVISEVLFKINILDVVIGTRILF
jgi:hypothetical protein